MEHFNIIQALCRSALSTPNSAVVQQVTRLKDALKKEGHNKEAKSLESLLTSSQKALEMIPSKIKQSFAIGKGDELTSKTPIPVDKETSTPLAEIHFGDDLPSEIPIFEDNIKEAIYSIINEWTKFDKLLEIEAYPASSCLIYGLPGTGKTHLAKWIAGQIGLPVVLARLEGLMSSFLGTTAKNIGNLFAFADRYNCVLLLDEFDAIAKLRNDPQEVGEVKRVVNTLLQCLDSRKDRGFTIGVTNHESLLDPAIWRRFDIQIEIPKPSPMVSISLLRKFLQPLEFADNEMKLFAWCLEDSTGADVEMLAKWIKRAYVIDKKMNISHIIKQFTLLNSGRVSEKKRNIILNSDEEFINALIEDDKYSFKQVDIAPLFGMTTSSLSKLKSKMK
ncbi:MAG: ATP-binding protein [Prevotella sp.]|jgi:SpoVK/Ycf46/Vps4 family AAA+-type ATPase|nr:ATP-binding protein [Prevotella sp.]